MSLTLKGYNMTDFINKCRAFGKNRLELSSKMKTPDDWKEKWPDSENDYIYKLGPCWTHMIEYYVDDFEAEVGFMIDVMGFKTFIVDTNERVCIVTNPGHNFYFSFYEASKQGKEPTPKDALKLSLMVEDIEEVGKKLESREIQFCDKLHPSMEGSPMLRGFIRTPAGIPIEFWGMAKQQ